MERFLDESSKIPSELYYLKIEFQTLLYLSGVFRIVSVIQLKSFYDDQ